MICYIQTTLNAEALTGAARQHVSTYNFGVFTVDPHRFVL